MRKSIVLLVLALAGVLGGGALIGLPALGACLIVDSLFVGYLALARDDGTASQPGARGAPSLPQVLERYRDAS